MKGSTHNHHRSRAGRFQFSFLVGFPLPPAGCPLKSTRSIREKTTRPPAKSSLRTACYHQEENSLCRIPPTTMSQPDPSTIPLSPRAKAFCNTLPDPSRTVPNSAFGCIQKSDENAKIKYKECKIECRKKAFGVECINFAQAKLGRSWGLAAAHTLPGGDILRLRLC